MENTYTVVVYSANIFSTPNFLIFVKNTTHNFLSLSHGRLKVKLSPSKKKLKSIEINCFNERPLKIKQNAFYFILKALFFLKIFKFLFCLYGHVEKKT